MAIPAKVGRYRITGELGRGAMGAVYRAHDPQLDRPVAIKMISASATGGSLRADESEARFLREARVAARLAHPSIVAVYDAGREGNDLYLVMELVEGESLAARLASGRYPSSAETFEIVAQAAEALAVAHAAGVVHRDVKPANLLIGRDGRVKVSDFGVAKAVGESTELTRTGMMVGSPAYMAPEQIQGQELDGRSDLFSLGVVLYELLLHRKPFPADTLTTLVYQILHQDPFESETVAGRLHPDLIDLLRWSLAKERDVRIPDAVTFAARARALAQQFSHAATAAPTPPGGAFGPTLASRPAPPPPLPLPPASYLTSAPTAIVRRPGGDARSWRRWLPWIAAGLLLAALVVGLALRSPAPPPDLEKAPASAGSGSGASAAEPQLSAPPAALPPESGAAAETPVAGQRVEQAPTTLAARPLPVIPVGATSAAPIAESASTTAAVDTAPAALPATEPPPPIATVFRCRRGAEFKVDPEEVLVTVDGQLLGEADDWDGAGGGKTYYFSGPGDHLVKLSLQGYRTVWVKVVVTPDAKRDVVSVDTELEEIE